MRKHLALIIFLIFSCVSGFSQGLSFTCPRDTILSCGNSCFNLPVKFPDIRSQTSNYEVTLQTPQTIQCYPQVPPGTPGPSANLTIDDRYSSVIPLPFPFTFYGTVYNSIIVSTNGFVSFDVSKTGTFSHYDDNGDLPNTLYDRAIIMGPYHDLDPSLNTSPTQQIKYETIGTAPNRKWVLSFFRVPMFNCTSLIDNIHQIVLNERTNIVEVVLVNKQICTTWQNGRAMVGIQNFDRTSGLMAPGRKESDLPWGSIGMNETWRFIPSAGAILYKSLRLLNSTGGIVATGDTTRIDAANFGWTFNNVCVPGGSTFFVVETTYDDPFTPGATLISRDTINVQKNAALPATATTTSTACGGANGTITVNVTPGNGVAPFQYSLNSGPLQAGNVFTNVGGGPQLVYVTDATGCDTAFTVIVAVTANIPSTFTSTQTTCNTASDGTITITPTGGSAPYLFTLTGPGGPYGPQASGTFTGLAAGTYAVSFADANGCTGSRTGMVVTSAGANPTASTSTTGTTCNGATNGTITINPNPAGNYIYTLNPGNVVQVNNNVFTGLASGTYTIFYQSPTGCSGTATGIIVPSGSQLSGAATTTATCSGGATGSITVQTTGAGPFTFTLNPGNITQTNPTFTGLAAGTYSATFTTAAGCTSAVINNIVVSNGAALTGTATATDPSCNGAADGTITVTASGGGPYTYTLNPGNITQSSNIFTGLNAGTYTITFTSGGCTGTVAPNTVVPAGTALTATATSTTTSCNTAADGTITVSPSGNGPFTFVLNPGNIAQSSPTFTGLSAGTYNITFSTASGCNGAVNPDVVVAAGPALSSTFSTTPTTCPTSADGSITVNVTGNGPFSYTLNPGNITQTSNVFTGLTAGNYTVNFSNAAGCTGSINGPAVVIAGPALSSTTTVTNAVCFGINDGSVIINPTSGNAPYAYTLLPATGPQASNSFTNLAPGTYNYSFSDAGNCTGAGTFTITSNPQITSTATVVQPLCNAGADGSVTFQVNGGVAPYTYLLQPGTVFQSSNTFNGLAAGTYTFTIRDNENCSRDTVITIAEPTPLTATAANTRPATCAGNDGEITITANGGTTPYQYSLDNGTTYVTNNVIVAPAVGAYNILVRDANGCIANASTTVALVDNMFLTLGPDTTICAGSPYTLQPQTNPQTNVFRWRSIPVSAINSLSDTTIKNPIATPNSSVQYVLNAAWGACSRTDTIAVNVLLRPVPNAGADQTICPYISTALTGSVSNTSGTVNYTWTPAVYLDTTGGQTVTATPPPGAATTFTLTVTDNYGCNYRETDEVVVTTRPPVQAFAGNDTIAVLGVPHQLFGTGGTVYSWTPGTPLNNPNIQNPLATLQNDTRFILRVEDVIGCTGFDTVFVKVYTGPTYYVPNAFTPNNDGRNDIFRAVPVGITSTEYFRVFNRYGQLVFETNKFLKGWNGTYLGRPQAGGAYVWMVKGLDRNGKTVEMKGTVILVR